VQAAQDLANGKIDCIVMDEAPAIELVESSNGKLEILAGDALFEDSYAVAIKKGNEAMKGACDTVISDLIESGEMDEIIAAHSSVSQSETEAE
jgi:polar amino acid transport system substrate-binding protein